MKANKFAVGQDYTGSEIKNILGSGTYYQVMVKSKTHGLLCVRFRDDINPNWEAKHEIWVHHGKKRIADAHRWIDEGTIVPVFCSRNNADYWTYLGQASASAIAIDEDAATYTEDDRVGLVLKMTFKSIANDKTKVVRRSNHGNSKRAA